MVAIDITNFKHLQYRIRVPISHMIWEGTSNSKTGYVSNWDAIPQTAKHGTRFSMV